MAPVLRDLIQTPNFRVVVVEDCEAVEVCGALKVCNYIYISPNINKTMLFLICVWYIVTLMFNLCEYTLHIRFRISWHVPLVS